MFHFVVELYLVMDFGVMSFVTCDVYNGQTTVLILIYKQKHTHTHTPTLVFLDLTHTHTIYIYKLVPWPKRYNQLVTTQTAGQKVRTTICSGFWRNCHHFLNGWNFVSISSLFSDLIRVPYSGRAWLRYSSVSERD